MPNRERRYTKTYISVVVRFHDLTFKNDTKFFNLKSLNASSDYRFTWRLKLVHDTYISVIQYFNKHGTTFAT